MPLEFLGKDKIVINKSILKSINVLYVEDEIKISKLTIDVLSKFVKSITSATDGEEGLEFFKKNHNSYNSKDEKIDIVITDINMPNMDGLTMIEEINKINSNIPSIIITAFNDNEFLKRSIDLGLMV